VNTEQFNKISEALQVCLGDISQKLTVSRCTSDDKDEIVCTFGSSHDVKFTFEQMGELFTQRRDILSQQLECLNKGLATVVSLRSKPYLREIGAASK
jgi:hypothetical protein